MNPYDNLPEKAYWKPAVAQRSLFDLVDLWDPRFPISPKDAVVTFGSCFAQHIGRAMLSRGFNWFSAEPGPVGLSAASRAKFNYNVFSARTGNIYTTSLLHQWVKWATGVTSPPDEVWEVKGRYYDPFRPAIEPDGFASKDEVLESRERAIEAFATCIRDAKVFVFTLGLTESWLNSEYGYEYPVCPGTVAGTFNSEKHVFRNQDYTECLASLMHAIKAMRQQNGSIRVILTVSPVPLTATNSGNHVLVATMHSKSILRAVAGKAVNHFDFVDYFPSYEIINSPAVRGTFFEPNMRSVNPRGVAFVMDQFFHSLIGKFGSPGELPVSGASGGAPAVSTADDIVCEEELLEAFGDAK